MHRDELAALMAERPGDDLVTVADVVAALTARPSWQADAECLGVGVDVFFIPRGGRTAPAKALCASCPVVEPCRSFAADNEAAGGIWAGETAGEIRSSGRRTPPETAEIGGRPLGSGLRLTPPGPRTLTP